MKLLSSPNEIFRAQCRAQILLLLESVNDAPAKLDELFDGTVDFLRFNMELIRDMPMLAALALVLYTAVDFRVVETDAAIKKRVYESLNCFVEEVLALTENEDLPQSSPMERLKLYFLLASAYSKLKPVANVIMIEQCYWESKGIVDSYKPKSLFEKHDISELWHNIDETHHFRFMTPEERANGSHTSTSTSTRTMYIQSNPFEGGGLYAPPLRAPTQLAPPTVNVTTRRRPRTRTRFEPQPSPEPVDVPKPSVNNVKEQVIATEPPKTESDQNDQKPKRIEENAPQEIPKAAPTPAPKEEAPPLPSYAPPASRNITHFYRPVIFPSAPPPNYKPNFDDGSPRVISNEIPVIVKKVVAELNEKFDQTDIQVRQLRSLQRPNFSLY